ncbi:MAG TPA: transglutaminase domain-containing protein [Chitinophagaceae bacterium]|jgi:hypothetical protein|nr:transglutaminase domain-containing protein [Chitinophagaceae bacterium]
MPKLFLLFIGLSFFLISRSQDRSPVKFGKISAAELKTKIYSIDSNASAIIIADIGSSEIAGNLKGWFSIEFKHFKRIHILNKNAYDLANVEVLLYAEGNNEEKLENLKAHTYNFENGKVVETKVDVKSSVYKSPLDKNHIVQKFAFPAIKEGSIIEYEYTISSDFIFNLQPWKFQGDHPVLWSEYVVSIPEFFYYVFLQHGAIKKTQTTRQQSFRVTDARAAVHSTSEPFIAGINDYRMIMKNILPLKEENFTSTLDNHIAKVEFQLAEFRTPLNPQNIMGDWEDVCETLLKDENFGGQLNKDNSWMNDELKIALGKAVKEEEKAKNIYKYLRDNFTCTSYSRLYADQPLKNVLKNKKGSEAEINLLLVAMLRKAGLTADPVMLSTRSHGYAYSNYPIMERFNYVVCRLKINDRVIFLDASRSLLGFGWLHWECYNGHARVINDEATPVEFLSDSLTERKITSLMLSSNDKGEIVGTLQQTPGYYESYDIRNDIKEKGLKEYVKETEKDLPADVEVKNYRIDLLEKLDEQIQISYDTKLDLEKKDIIYLDPMFGEGFSENPFTSEKRTYPVEMPYAFDEIYVLRMDIPQGYEVSELPASIKVNFDEEGKSFFEYIVEDTGRVISFRTRVKMHRSYFLADEYKILHDFFDLVVSKQSEKIVLKKIKRL